ncbi:uncharacterized protein LOC125818470 [Solanum verrucosum]|uniref:Large ribosomal subunit protein bL12c n=1 Tax=Solanum demissum TaxID=50514 RepID=Q0KIV9_SOLDE|nr:uncharacterized protein LOC125818470 [Solanum verrucosum]ABI49504.1 Ribosomal protein L7/L12 C-terminal domain containing protein [Solanum demissum]
MIGVECRVCCERRLKVVKTLDRGVNLLGRGERKLPADYDPVTFDPTEHRSPPSERVWRLVDEVSGLTLVEVTEVSSIIMKRLGMTEQPTVGVMKAGAAELAAAMKGPEAAKEEKKPEKTVFELKLESFESAQKIKIIKEVRSSTDLGLKEAKDLVEKTPAVFKKGVSKEKAEQIIDKMKAVGAKMAKTQPSSRKRRMDEAIEDPDKICTSSRMMKNKSINFHMRTGNCTQFINEQDGQVTISRGALGPKEIDCSWVQIDRNE